MAPKRDPVSRAPDTESRWGRLLRMLLRLLGLRRIWASLGHHLRTFRALQ